MNIAIVIAAVLFSTMMLSLSLYGLALSGHFPREFRASVLQGTKGTLVIVACTIVAIAALAVGIAGGYRLLPWFVLVIGGGGGVLMAPLVLAMFSDGFVNGAASLLIFSAGGLLLALGLHAI